MEIEKAIHGILSAVPASGSPLQSLLSLCPLENITTGKNWTDQETFPYITFNLENDQKEFYSNAGQARTPSVRFTVFDDNHSRACSIREFLIGVFDNTGKDLSNFKILMMRHENDFAIQDEDEIWQFTIDFNLLTYKE